MIIEIFGEALVGKGFSQVVVIQNWLYKVNEVMFVLFPVHKVHNDAGRISSKEKAFFWQLTLSHKVAAHV